MYLHHGNLEQVIFKIVKGEIMNWINRLLQRVHVPKDYDSFVQKKTSGAQELMHLDNDTTVYEFIQCLPPHALMRIKGFYNEAPTLEEKKDTRNIYDSGIIAKEKFLGTIDTIMQENKHYSSGVLFTTGNEKKKTLTIALHFEPKAVEESTINAIAKYNF
jgi:hypothetical protein